MIFDEPNGALARIACKPRDYWQQDIRDADVMESTASYWKPLYNIFETCELQIMVVDAHHMKAVPVCKTDIKEAERIADLLQHGLLTASYIPDKDQRELREQTQLFLGIICTNQCTSQKETSFGSG